MMRQSEKGAEMIGMRVETSETIALVSKMVANDVSNGVREEGMRWNGSQSDGHAGEWVKDDEHERRSSLRQMWRRRSSRVGREASS